MRKSLLLILMYLICAGAQAQSVNTIPVQPFLFSVTTFTSDNPVWGLSYSGSYGERASGPFGYDGVDQKLEFKGYLGNKFTLFANAAIGFTHSGKVNSAQQVEVIHDFIGGKHTAGARLGLSAGVNRDWDNVKSVFSRIAGTYDAAKWRIGGNMRFEKAFSQTRDGLDLITSIGVHRKIAGHVFGGFEAVGQDLEGFWEKDEAEGGAKMLVGPSVTVSSSRFAFSVCGGPVFHATRSTFPVSAAIRDLSTDTGYTIRASFSFKLH